MLQRVDNSALYHCAMMSNNYINSFRLKVVFKDKIDKDLLLQASKTLIKRFPSFFASITNDNYWYYTKTLKELIIHEYKDEFQTVKYIDIDKYAIALLVDEYTLVLEVFHAVSDGVGALYVFKELVKAYLELKWGQDINYQDYVLEENIDSYNEVPKVPKINKNTIINKPFMFTGKNFEAIPLVKTYEFDLNNFKSYSKQFGCTVNDLVVLLFYRAIKEVRQNKREISVLLPINLRKHFNSKTVKNFILTSRIALQNSDDFTIINDIKQQLKAQNNYANLAYEVNKINRIYRNPLIKYIPIGIKCLFIKLTYHLGRKENTCITLSNLGKVEFGGLYDQYIDKLCFALSPRFNGPYNCGIVSHNNKMIIEITHDDSNHHLLEAFEKVLKQYRINYK